MMTCKTCLHNGTDCAGCAGSGLRRCRSWEKKPDDGGIMVAVAAAIRRLYPGAPLFGGRDALERWHKENKAYIQSEKAVCLTLATVLPRWISVKERLPEEKVSRLTGDFLAYPVIFQTEDGAREVRFYQFGDGHFRHGAKVIDGYIVAWMERPELPKEKDNVD